MFERIIPQNTITPEVISFKTMRLLVGILAISFPFILLFGSLLFGGCKEIQSSISAYYHTKMRDIFVGILCAVSLFLFSYKGYDQEDFLTSKFASFYALGIALFPTMIKENIPTCIQQPIASNNIISNFHYYFAASFFITIACISICIFTKTHPKERNIELKKEKLNRNKVYITCGILILVFIGLIFLYDKLIKRYFPLPFSPIYWLETFALVSFGISWLVKGGGVKVLNDK